MTDPQVPTSARELVRRICERLQAAVGAARAAEACAEAGDTDQALMMLCDVEPPLYEAATLLNAVSILRGNHRR
jgi:hypothetical protein